MPFSCRIPNFSFEVDIEVALSSCENSSIDFCSDEKLSDLQYAEEVLLLSKDSRRLSVFVDHLEDRADVFGMHFTSSKW